MIDKHKILVKTIYRYGEVNQHFKLMEECAELIQAVAKYQTSETAKEKLIQRNHIKEEMADVVIMIEQLKLLHDIKDGELEKEVEYKLARLQGRMDD